MKTVKQLLKESSGLEDAVKQGPLKVQKAYKDFLSFLEIRQIEILPIQEGEKEKRIVLLKDCLRVLKGHLEKDYSGAWHVLQGFVLMSSFESEDLSGEYGIKVDKIPIQDEVFVDLLTLKEFVDMMNF